MKYNLEQLKTKTQINLNMLSKLTKHRKAPGIQCGSLYLHYYLGLRVELSQVYVAINQNFLAIYSTRNYRIATIINIKLLFRV